MEYLGQIATFTFNMAASFFSWMMSSWVTAAFPVAAIICFIVNLVIASASGSDDDK